MGGFPDPWSEPDPRGNAGGNPSDAPVWQLSDNSLVGVLLDASTIAEAAARDVEGILTRDGISPVARVFPWKHAGNTLSVLVFVQTTWGYNVFAATKQVRDRVVDALKNLHPAIGRVAVAATVQDVITPLGTPSIDPQQLHAGAASYDDDDEPADWVVQLTDRALKTVVVHAAGVDQDPGVAIVVDLEEERISLQVRDSVTAERLAHSGIGLIQHAMLQHFDFLPEVHLIAL